RGGTLVLRTEEMIGSVERFVALSAAWGLGLLSMPTAYWHALAHALGQGSVRLPRAVRQLLMGGEQARVERLADWRRAVEGRVRLINVYGPTEATISTTVAELVGAVEALPRTVPLGRPIANVPVYVLDRQM